MERKEKMDDFSYRFRTAVKVQDFQSVNNLLDNGFDIHHIGENDENIFHFLARESRNGTLDEFDHLCDKVNINHKDANGITPLMVAVAALDNVTSRIEYFLRKGADVNIVNNKGQTALMLCAIYGYSTHIKLLLYAGADVNSVDKEGQTALMMICAKHNPGSSQMKLLLDVGADVNRVDNEGKTVLMMICAKSDYRDDNTIKLLLKAGSDVNIVDKEGQTALMICARYNPRYIKLLLDAGADVNRINKEGQTVLMIYAENSNTCFNTHVKLLLDAGSNPNIHDKNGRTVLQYVNKYTWDLNLDYLKLFLQYGGSVSLDIKTAAGFTPLQYVLNTAHYSMFWHLIAENCSLESLKAVNLNKSIPSKIFRKMSSKKVKLGNILFLCGAPKQIIQKTLNFQSNDKHRFHKYCNNMPLNKLCRRRLRNSIGAGIQQKLSNDRQKQKIQEELLLLPSNETRFHIYCNNISLKELCQRKLRNSIGAGIQQKLSNIPGLLHDFIMFKDVFPADVFDPNKISDK